jgi:hypothetical protein
MKRRIVFVVATLTLLNMSIALVAQEIAEPAIQRAKQVLSVLEREYQARVSALGRMKDGKDQYEASAKEAVKLFTAHCGKNPAEQRKLADAILSVPDSDFAHFALEQLTYLLAHEGRRDALVELLSKRCPQRLSMNGIEDALVILCERELPDGAIVLCDAFEQSTDSTARDQIATALRRGFEFANLPPQNDRDFVKECRRWYAANRKNYETNSRYLGHLNLQFDDYRHEGLFVPLGTNARRLNEFETRPQSKAIER